MAGASIFDEWERLLETENRPLSPHLQVYRLPVTAVLSITHRITGIILTLGLLLMAVYLMAIAEGEEAFAVMQTFLASLGGRILIFVWLFTLFFHFSHGIRHLIWDTGKSLEREDMAKYGYTEIVASILLTFFFGMIGYLMR